MPTVPPALTVDDSDGDLHDEWGESDGERRAPDIAGCLQALGLRVAPWECAAVQAAMDEESRLYFGLSRAQSWGGDSGLGASAGFPLELAAVGFDLRELARRRRSRHSASRLSVERVDAVCESALRVGVGAHGRAFTPFERATLTRDMLTLPSFAKEGVPILRPLNFRPTVRPPLEGVAAVGRLGAALTGDTPPR